MENTDKTNLYKQSNKKQEEECDYSVIVFLISFGFIFLIFVTAILIPNVPDKINFNETFNGIICIIEPIFKWVTYNFNPFASPISIITDLVIILTLIIGYSQKRKELTYFSHKFLILNIINPFNLFVVFFGLIFTEPLFGVTSTEFKLIWDFINVSVLALISFFISKDLMLDENKKKQQKLKEVKNE